MNWGTKIILGMVAFMIFIVAMVVYMFSVHGNDALVDEDYYEKGINYNQEYRSKQNVIDDGAQPAIKVSNTHISIQLKDSARYELKLMRPTTSKDDIKRIGITPSGSKLILVDRTKMHSGLWFLELKWISNDKTYFFKKDILL